MTLDDLFSKETFILWKTYLFGVNQKCRILSPSLGSGSVVASVVACSGFVGGAFRRVTSALVSENASTGAIFINISTKAIYCILDHHNQYSCEDQILSFLLMACFNKLLCNLGTTLWKFLHHFRLFTYLCIGDIILGFYHAQIM